MYLVQMLLLKFKHELYITIVALMIITKNLSSQWDTDNELEKTLLRLCKLEILFDSYEGN